MTRAASFAPIVQPDTRLLILGSLPGTASLAAGRYYAHPRNQFWKLIGAVLGTELEALDYPARLHQLAHHKVGLWDVVASANRPGSLDARIQDHVPNELQALADTLPHLGAIAFNGATAFALGSALLSGTTSISLIRLPSSSPANARASLDQKRALWLAMQPLLAAGELRAGR